MDFSTLYEAWKREKENNELQSLNKQFYMELSKYRQTYLEELQMLDDKTLRAQLSTENNLRIEKLFKDLVWTRYGKTCKIVQGGKIVSMNLLTHEEESIYKDITSSFEKATNLEKDINRGHIVQFTNSNTAKLGFIRFLQAIPAIVGSDTRIYGPFKVEDVASLPIDNAESLIKRGIAVKVEIE